MKNLNIKGIKLSRLAISVFTLAMVAAAFGQARPVVDGAKLDNTQRLQPGEVRGLKPSTNQVTWSTVDTSRVFPPIAKALTARGVRPSNPSIEPEPPFSIEELKSRLGIDDKEGLPPTVGGQTATSILGVDAKFPGISFTGSVPPDNHMAVGPDHIVEVVNSTVAFYNKNTGQLQFQQPLSSTGFLPRSGNFVFDPRVLYDMDHERWVVLALDVDFNNNKTYVHLAFSDDANPNGKWKIAKIDNSLPDGNGNPRWGDYPNMTHSENSVVMTFNHFPFQGGSVSGTVFVFRTTDNQLFSGESGMFGMQMAKKMTAGPEIPVGMGLTFPFMFGAVPINPTVQLMAVNDTGAVPTISGRGVNIPVFVRQQEGAQTGGFMIDAIGDRMMDASRTGDSVVFAFTCNIGPDNLGYTTASLGAPVPRQTKVRWGEVRLNGWPLSANNPSFVQAGDLAKPSGSGVSYLMPAVAKNTEGSIAIVATEAAVDGTPKVVGAGRRPTDALGTMGPATVFASSPNFMLAGSTDGTSRWGDYAGIGLDPKITDTFWGVHELFADPSLRWKTEIFKLRVKNSDIQVRNFLSVSPIFGSNTAGNLSSFTTEGDSNIYTLDSEFVGNRGNYAGFEAVLDGTALKDGARVTFVMAASVPGVSGFIYAYNNQTGNYDLLSSKRLKTTMATYDQLFPTDFFVKYRNSTNGQIILRFVTLNTVQRRGTAPVPFQFHTDFGAVTINEI